MKQQVAEGVETSLVENVGLRFTRLWLDSKTIRFEARIVPTRVGEDLTKIVQAGLKVGVSSRGWGSVKREQWEGEEAWVVQDDYSFDAFDVVLSPAESTARLEVAESKQLGETPSRLDAVAQAVLAWRDELENRAFRIDRRSRLDV